MRLIVEIARQGYNVSRAAEAMNTPQPAVSRQLRALERELGVDIFVRNQNRLRGLTRPGNDILEVAQRIVDDTANIGKIAREFRDIRSGRLTIATTHTQARYALPPLIRRFSCNYPEVEVMIRQGSPAEILELVRDGEADVCIGSDSAEGSDLLLFPCYPMHRIVLTPPDHPLLAARRPTLETLARFPIITYDAPFIGRSKLVQSFAQHGLTPKIVLSAIDTDVIKAYVEHGLGIAIVAKLAFDAERDAKLRAIDVSHLFEPNTIHLGIRRNDYLRGYVFEFIEMFAPHLKRKQVESRLRAAMAGRRATAVTTAKRTSVTRKRPARAR
jgi:LysR family cys regulon transcriptional activator